MKRNNRLTIKMITKKKIAKYRGGFLIYVCSNDDYCIYYIKNNTLHFVADNTDEFKQFQNNHDGELGLPGTTLKEVLDDNEWFWGVKIIATIKKYKPELFLLYL